MQCVRESEFDVLVLDLSMPGRNGMELIKLVRSEKPKVRILVLSMHQELQYAVRAIKSGASGYLTKEIAPEQLEQAIRKIAAGGAFISTEVAEQLALSAMPGGTSASHESLSNRECEVFRLIAAGISVTNIATLLKLSVKTISTHKTNLMQKMGLPNQSELIRYAIKHGVSEPLSPATKPLLIGLCRFPPPCVRLDVSKFNADDPRRSDITCKEIGILPVLFPEGRETVPVESSLRAIPHVF